MMQNPLVTTQWLHDRLDDPTLRIVDIRGHVLPASVPPPHYFNHYDDYQQAHIPGAVFVDWVHEITDPADPRHARIAPPQRYAALMSRLGIGAETFVVAYDDAHSMFAARLWWSLSYYGHKQVTVLDGGWKKWTAEGRPVSADIPQITPAVFTPRPNPAIHRSADEVLAALDGDNMTLLDVRSPEEYAGKVSRTNRAGHIPGAVNLPTTKLYNADDTLLTPEQLREQFAGVGVDAQTENVVTYCNAGVSASLGMLALRAAGISHTAVYDGSWKDWSNDSDKPITAGG